LKSIAERRSKTESQELKTNNCIDWYLVTTYYNADGSSESTWHYISTTCNCEQTRIAAGGRSYRLNCSGGGGGGDIIDYDLEAEAALLNEAFSISSSSPIQRIVTFTSETMAEVPFQWEVVKNITNTWRVTSYDVADGYNSNNAGAIIYRIRHLSSNISGITNLYRIPRGGTGPHIPLAILSWAEDYVSTNIDSDYKSGTVNVSGNVKNFGRRFRGAYNSCTVTVW
jgi:hypothetical protein